MQSPTLGFGPLLGAGVELVNQLVRFEFMRIGVQDAVQSGLVGGWLGVMLGIMGIFCGLGLVVSGIVCNSFLAE